PLALKFMTLPPNGCCATAENQAVHAARRRNEGSFIPLMNRAPNFHQPTKHSRHFAQWHHVWAVAQCPIRVWMGFDKNPIRSSRYRAPRQHGSKFALTARLSAPSARQLHRMRGVENHRKSKSTHDGDGAHIGH